MPNTVPLVFILVLLAWFFTLGASLYLLIRKRHLSDMARILWTLVIILIPFLGPAAFAAVTYDRRPSNLQQDETKNT